MENQYNYYNSDGMNGNVQSETPFHDDNGGQKHRVPHGKKPQKKIPKAVAVTGFALLFGVVSSGTFLASNVVGSKMLGLTGVTKTNTTATKAVQQCFLIQIIQCCNFRCFKYCGKCNAINRINYKYECAAGSGFLRWCVTATE